MASVSFALSISAPDGDQIRTRSINIAAAANTPETLIRFREALAVAAGELATLRRRADELYAAKEAQAGEWPLPVEGSLP